MNKILVTGGNGMVGRALHELVDSCNYSTNYEWIFISSKDCDLTIRNDVIKLFDLHKPQYIIHLAAKVGGLYYNMREGTKMFTDNVRMNENILEACDLFNVIKGIFCLSTCIFPENPSKYPLDESMIHESSPHPSNEGYAYAKRMLEMQCRNFNKLHNKKYICVVPVNLYGPYDNFNLENSHVIPGLIHKFYLAKKNNTDIHIAGTGIAQRQFLYSYDFAKIILKIFFEYDDTKSIICANDEIAIKDLISCISKEFDFKGNIIYDSTKSDGCIKKTASNEYLLELFADLQFTNITDGITETIKWFENNYPSNVRL